MIFVGPGDLALPSDAPSNLIDLGFIPLQDKYDAFAAASVLCQPSANESFSLVIMESWLTGTPVLVHGDCAVTREHCQNSNGGLYFTNYDEFVATVDYLLSNTSTAHQMGRNGRDYVMANFQWPTIIDKYTQLINSIIAEL